jgi:glycosyltransferase involved in cell wall biosynthesis
VWNQRTVAVILPTYNEAASIRECIEDFVATGVVDEIVVVNNNAHHETSAEVSRTCAREVHEPVQGYGAAIRRGLAETSSFDVVCICEPDGTFDPHDLLKLLPFLSDTDVVLGSRTVNTFIFDGANMGAFLRWGNWFVAKLIEVLFNTAYLSDVGCTFRVMSRRAVDLVEKDLKGHGSSLGLELQVRIVVRRIPFVQVPVRYLPRVGQSSVTGQLSKSLSLGLTMIGIVLRQRFSSRRGPRVNGRRPCPIGDRPRSQAREEDGPPTVAVPVSRTRTARPGTG